MINNICSELKTPIFIIGKILFLVLNPLFSCILYGIVQIKSLLLLLLLSNFNMASSNFNMACPILIWHRLILKWHRPILIWIRPNHTCTDLPRQLICTVTRDVFFFLLNIQIYV